MKTLFIEAETNLTIEIPLQVIEKLPHELAVFTTIQFMPQLPEIKKTIEATGRIVKLLQGKHTRHAGQILGCEFLEYDAPAFLFIGDGKFHPEAIMMQNPKPVFQYDPFRETLEELDRTEIEKLIKQHRGAIMKFFDADVVGVLVSTKPGQGFLKRAMEFKEKLNGKKEVCIFICDTIDFTQLENFPFVQCWVNTACPRIALDDKKKFFKPVINLDDVWEMVMKE